MISFARSVSGSTRWSRFCHESARLTVASVHGAVAGGGLGAMLACDVVIASEDTAFTLGYAKLATNPDAGVSWFLPRIVGYRKALELYLTSQRLSAAEALELGLVNFVVPSDELASATRKLTSELCSWPRTRSHPPSSCFSRAPNQPWSATQTPRFAPSRTTPARRPLPRASPHFSGSNPVPARRLRHRTRSESGSPAQ